MINTADPDIDLVQEIVEAPIDKAEGDAGLRRGAPEEEEPGRRSRAAPYGTFPGGYAANQADDLGAPADPHAPREHCIEHRPIRAARARDPARREQDGDGGVTSTGATW